MYDRKLIGLLFTLTRISIRVYSREWKEEEGMVFQAEPEAFERKRMEELKERLEQEEICFLPYEEEVPVALCGCRGREEYFILGPFSYGRIDTFSCRTFLKKNRIRECPPCQLEDVYAMAGFLSGKEWTGQSLTEEKRNLLVNEEIRQWDTFQKNHTYQEEQILYEYIREGNVKFLRENLQYLSPSHPVLMEDLKKNEEYMAVISISMAARAAIEGGLSSREGFINNDIYLKKLSRCRSVQEIQQVREESQLYFTSLVAEHKKKSGQNFHVEEIKKHILAKRFQRISISQLAEEVGLSPEYMQKLFKKYEGISITEYMGQIRIEAACNLLKYSDRQIQEIGTYLQYGSVSHFSGEFRKKMKLSPREYREKYRRTFC